jgi:hypothetical protein
MPRCRRARRTAPDRRRGSPADAAPSRAPTRRAPNRIRALPLYLTSGDKSQPLPGVGLAPTSPIATSLTAAHPRKRALPRQGGPHPPRANGSSTASASTAPPLTLTLAVVRVGAARAAVARPSWQRPSVAPRCWICLLAALSTAFRLALSVDEPRECGHESGHRGSFSGTARAVDAPADAGRPLDELAQHVEVDVGEALQIQAALAGLVRP